LSANESALGFSPRVKKKLSKINLLSKYPDSKSKSLRKEISKKFRCNFDQIICGSGSDEIIQMICQLFLTKSDEVIVPKYSFLMYRIYSGIIGAKVIYADEENFKVSVDNILKNFIDQNSPVINGESKDGVTNTLWKIDDEKKINQIIESFKSKEILIADGHHRYETSLNYYKDFPDDKNKYTMFYLAGSNQEGLLINPTHRILQNVKESNLLIDQIKKDFDCENYNEEINEDFLNPDEFFVISKEANIILKCKIKEENRDKFYSMSVYGVQEFIIDKFKDNYNGLDFFKSFNDANDSILENSLGLILPKFVPPDIMKVVLNDDKMPQKSTYFYPKVATGVLFNKLS